MSEQRQQNKNPQNPKRPNKRIRLAVTIIVIATIICCVFWKIGLWNLQSVDEQLAAIEATRAIPDSENAATIYRQLLQDPNATSLLDYRPAFLDDDSDNLTFRQPWSGKDFPQLGAWLKEQQPVIDRLFKASKFDKCRFPIAIAALPDHLTAMRKWTFLLKRAGNNDIGEGRIDDAIDKWRCLVQIGNHLRQQPLFDAHLVAFAIEAVALNQTVVFLGEGNANERHLCEIETFSLHTEDDWAAVLEEILPAEQVAEQKMKQKFGLVERIKYEFGYGFFASVKDRDLDKIRRQYRALVAISRGVHILVALRRYKNEQGRWPRSLDAIQSQVPARMLIDPFNNSSFVYRLTDDSFSLYSKGKNKIDENGKYKGGCDDWPIWPPRGRESKSKDGDADSAKASMSE